MITGEIIRGHTSPIAVASKCGWMLIDPVKLCGTVPTHTAPLLIWLSLAMERRNRLAGDDNAFIGRFHLGFGFVRNNRDKGRKREFMEDIRFSSPRYEVGLPWKHGELVRVIWNFVPVD